MSTISLYSRRFIGWILLMFLLTTGIRLTKSAWDLWHLRGRVTEAEAEVREMAMEKERLEREVASQKDPYFLEREIRDSLGMAREDELVILLPQDQGVGSEQVEVGNEPERVIDERPNWQKWWEILLGKDTN